MATIDATFDAQMRGPSWTIRMVVLSVGLFVVWAGYAKLDEIVRGNGEMVSSSRPQIIQNLEGGILSEMLVGEGDRVRSGDVLARLQGTQFSTTVADLQDQIDTLQVRQLRLEAELDGATRFEVPTDLAGRQPDMVASELALLHARQSDFESRASGARKVLKQAAKELSLLEQLLGEKVVSLIEVTRARKVHSDAEAKVNDIVTKAELERASAYSDTLKELATLRQSQKISKDQLERTVIRSPMAGIVNAVAVSTIGGVVRPGEEIFQIIPLDEELFVEAKVKPQDIAGVAPGQKATVKLSAYDYTIYGALSGEVTVISADTFEDERVPDGDSHYRVTLRLDMDELTARQRDLALRPGMQASVELHTGEKSVLQYLTKPLYKSREALRER